MEVIRINKNSFFFTRPLYVSKPRLSLFLSNLPCKTRRSDLLLRIYGFHCNQSATHLWLSLQPVCDAYMAFIAISLRRRARGNAVLDLVYIGLILVCAYKLINTPPPVFKIFFLTTLMCRPTDL